MNSILRFAARLIGEAIFSSAITVFPALAQSSARPTVILTLPPRWVSEAFTHPYRYDYELHASSALCAQAKSFHCRIIPLNSKSMPQLQADARKAKGDVLIIGDSAEALNGGGPAQIFVKAWAEAERSGQFKGFKAEYAK